MLFTNSMLFIEHRHKIVLIEGIYLLLNTPPWDQLANLFNEKWFIEIPIDQAMYVLLHQISACKSLL